MIAGLCADTTSCEAQPYIPNYHPNPMALLTLNKSLQLVTSISSIFTQEILVQILLISLNTIDI